MKVVSLRIELPNGKLVDVADDYPHGLIIDGVLQELSDEERELARATWSGAVTAATGSC